MNKGEVIILGLVIFSIMVAGLSAASFNYRGNTLQTSYSAGERISGAINTSFSAESSDAVFRSNFNGSLTLLELLKRNSFEEGIDYNCTYRGCLDNYEVGSAITGVDLEDGESSVIGFKITGDDIELISLKFSIASSASQSSCSRQIIFDVLDKDESFIQNNKNSGEVCGDVLTGCFNEGLGEYESIFITTNPSCEKIALEGAPAYKLGAQIDVGTSDANLFMSLSDLEGNTLSDCELTPPSTPSGEASCVVNYSMVEGGDYYVCVRSDSDESDYKMRAESRSPVCGSDGLDYEIFAAPMKFAKVGSMNISSDVFDEQNPDAGGFVSYISSYISDRYGEGMNCSKGCIIPISIEGIAQHLSFNNAELRYKKGGITTGNSNVYALTKQKSKITTNGVLNVDVGVTGIAVPLNASNNTKLYLYLDNRAILNSPLSLAITPSFNFDITPKNVLFGLKTNFYAVSSANIVSASWDFGDGTTGTSPGRSISHRYTQYHEEGYTVVAELTRSDGIRSRRSFDVGVGSLVDSANALVLEYNGTVTNLSKEISRFTGFAAEAIRNKLNLEGMKTGLIIARSALANASTDDDYQLIINNLLALNIPESIAVSEEGSGPITGGYENINIGLLEQVSEVGTGGVQTEIRNAITSWLGNNYDTNINYKVFSAVDENGDKTPLLTDIKISLTKKSNADSSASEAYLFIDYPKESIAFAGNYSEKSILSGAYLPVSDSATIEFAVPGKIAPAALGMYISPSVDKLSAYQQIEVVKAAGFNWGRFILWMTILLIIALAVYIALQEWYKRKYESYLFKSPNDLYNVINFIHNSRKNGLENYEISKKLKSAGWNGEQIAYAYKKLDGIRTGMFEIPIFRFLEKKKINEEIEKRKPAQQVPQNAPGQTQTKPLLK